MLLRNRLLHNLFNNLLASSKAVFMTLKINLAGQKIEIGT